MKSRLSDRKETILRIVVEEYVRTGNPVPSLDVSRFHALRVGPATIRNELAWLKQEGYLAQPHTSAGSIPSDRGYRYYVNSLLENVDISPEEQRLVRHMFHQVQTDLEEWMGLAALLLAQLVHNAAFVVPPKAARARLKRLHLIAVQELLALLVLIFQDGRLRRQLVALDQPMSQDQLDRLSNKLNSMCDGMTRPQIAAVPGGFSDAETKVLQTTAGLMAAEDSREYQEPKVEGLRNLLRQPEFSKGETALDVIELLENRALLKPMLSRGVDQRVQVIIGEENPEQSLQDLSVVMSGYGLPEQSSGAVGVLGPRRMSYSRTIASVRFLALLLGQLAAEMEGASNTGSAQ